MPTLQTFQTFQTLNETVREHETSIPWEYRELAQTCYTTYDLFNARFFDNALSTCFLCFDKINHKQAGRHLIGQNAVGAECEILLNVKQFHLPLAQVLATLLHQMLHQHEALNGRKDARHYHTRAFQAATQAMGIPAEAGFKCVVKECTEDFLRLLQEAGIDGEAIALPDAQAPQPGNSTLRKWRCGCTNIRAAVQLRARCEACGEPFALVV
jgi:hypothetical protein